MMDRDMNEKKMAGSKTIRVANALGIHSRPAAKIVEMSSHATGRVWLSQGDERVDAKSILDILTLGCSHGSEVTLSMENVKDATILSKIAKTIEQGFGE